ncbi:MAG: mechanosensitive ion channel family protein [Firmicutes bacterium]|nr:mechanosensitive ion channel family protein [Bacillota bacterium]
MAEDALGHRPSPGSVWRTLALVVAALVLADLAASWAADAVPLLGLGAASPLVHAVLAAAWLGAGALLVERGRRRLRLERDTRPAGERRPWNLALNVFAALGYAYLLLAALALLRVDLRGILVGGAVTGIVLGVAAQSALGNMFGGMLVLLLHPYGVGDRIMVRSAAFGGAEYAGTVREVTLFYTVLEAAAGRLVIPNALAVASVVRVEGDDAAESVLVPVPYRVPVERLRAALREAGLPDEVRVELFGPDGYSARLRLPAVGGAAALVGVLSRLGQGPP